MNIYTSTPFCLVFALQCLSFTVNAEQVQFEPAKVQPAGQVQSQPDISNKQEEKKSEDFIDLVLSDKLYQEAFKKPLNGKRLRQDSLEQYDELEKGISLFTHSVLLKKDGVITLAIESKAGSAIKGYVVYDTNSRSITINFGPEYGAVKLKASGKLDEALKSKYDELEKHYKINQTKEARFEYSTTATLDIAAKKFEEKGTYIVELDGKVSKEEYKSEDPKIRAAANYYWGLLKNVVDQVIDEVPGDSKVAKIEDYEKFTKDLKPIKGCFTFYQKKDEIFLELNEADLGKIWLCQAAVHSSNLDSVLAPGYILHNIGRAEDFGNMVQPFKWVRRGDNLILVSPQSVYKQGNQFKIQGPSEIGFSEPVLASFNIEQEHPEKKAILINASSFFRGQTYQVEKFIERAAGMGYQLDLKTTFIDSIQSSPDSGGVRMNLHFVKMFGDLKGLGEDKKIKTMKPSYARNNPVNRLIDDRSVNLKITYSFWYRKPSNYMSRLADHRIGLIDQTYTDLNNLHKFNPSFKYVARRHLEKSNPSAKISEPIKPVVFTLYNIPLEYKEAVKRGVLMWNQAFEKLGFKEAIRVQDAPKDTNWDHADACYNVIRWTVEDMPGAYTMVRTDPFTGEILNTTINFNSHLLRIFNEKMAAAKMSSTNANYTKAIQLLKPLNLYSNQIGGVKNDQSIVTPCEDHMKFQASSCCNFMGDLQMNMARGFSLLKANPAYSKEKYNKQDFYKQMITYYIGHEVGHALGLDHNFLAQNYHSLEKLGDDKFVEKEGLSASIMAYLPVNPKAIEKGKGYFFTPTIGKYDYWAIEYLYKPLGYNTPDEEKPELLKIAARSTEPGLAYAGDKDLLKDNSYVNIFSLGDDPVKFVEITNRLSKNALNEQFKKFNSTHKDNNKSILRTLCLLIAPFDYAWYLTRFIGGVESAKTIVDKKEIPVKVRPVGAKSQQRALELLLKDCLTLDHTELPLDVLNNIPSLSDQLKSSYGSIKLKSYLSKEQILVLSSIIDPNKISNIIENEDRYEDRTKSYKATDHYRTISNFLFANVSNKSIPSAKRDLQRYYLKVLLGQVYGGNLLNPIECGDVRLIAKSEVNYLKNVIQSSQQTNSSDELTKLHLQDLLDEIKKVENRTVNEVVFR